MKKILVLVLLVVVFAPFQNAKAADPAVIQMKLGHFAADSHPGNVAVKMFIEAVEKRTNGTIKIANFPNNALGSPPEVLEQNILGAVDMSLPTQGQLGKYSKKFNCVMLPFLMRTMLMPTRYWTAPSSHGRRRISTRRASYSFRTGNGVSATSPTANGR